MIVIMISLLISSITLSCTHSHLRQLNHFIRDSVLINRKADQQRQCIHNVFPHRHQVPSKETHGAWSSICNCFDEIEKAPGTGGLPVGLWRKGGDVVDEERVEFVTDVGKEFNFIWLAGLRRGI